MKSLAALLLTLMLACSGAETALAQGASVREVLSNDSIIKLVKAGFKENTIIALIRTSPISFDLTTAKLVVLKKNHVSEKIITAMIERQTYSAGGNGMLSLKDDEFFRQDEDEFFRGVEPGGPGAADPRTQDNETSIFGSRSGGRSKTESRGTGGNGSASGQTETLGSASVKILRPPSEAGSGEPKLERAPKLNNQAVLDLIQAGFSEGTILRKIERSQVDFDLSSKALAELRKQRVSETVIKAMAEAMGVEFN
jgi:hypothetical protein